MESKIFYNGQITTMDDTQPQAEAVYVENGKIAAVGSNEEIRLQLGRQDVKQVDLEGHFVYPGLVDNHMHLPAHGMKLAMLDFSSVHSKEEMLNILREKVNQTPEGEWVLGLNWNENQFPGAEIPTIGELDEVAPHHPVFLTRTCYHAYLANRKAFEHAGLSANVTDPSDGSYGRDEQGNLNGQVFENASEPFKKAQPQPTYDDLKDYVRLAMKHAMENGITGVHTDDLRYLGSIADTMKIYRELVEEGLPLRSHHLIYYPHLEELDTLNMRAGDGDEWFRIGAVKMFADGAIGGRTALLSQPYADAPNTKGMAILTQAELNNITLQARRRGMSIAVHAIGDGAADMVLEAMEKYPIEQYVKGNIRDRLIHAQFLREDLVERLQKRQVAVDIQPRFVVSDFPWVAERVGEQRLSHAYAWKTLLDAGLYCGAGSDAPIEPVEPLLGIHAAVTRRKPEEAHEGYLPQQKLSPNQALQLFTVGSALTAGEEQERGTLTVGKYADLTVFDRNLLQGESDGILQAKTMMTVTNGRIGYQG